MLRILFKKYLNNDCTRKELILFLQLMNEEKNQQTVEVLLEEQWECQINPRADFTLSEKRVVPEKTHRDLYFRVRGLRVAAILILLVLSSLFVVSVIKERNALQNQNILVEKNTKAGQRIKLKLSDGSLIRMNADSRIEIFNHYNDKTRKVKLSGEAFFNIRHDTLCPFIVDAGRMQIQVLGTSFNIKAFNDEPKTEVSVYTGKVRVVYKERNKTIVRILLPSDLLTFNKKTGSVRIKRIAGNIRPDAWTQGRLAFDHTPVQEVIRMIERWYDVKVIVADPEILNHRISGDHWNENLISVAEALKFTLRIDYTYSNDTLLLKRRK